MDPAIASRFPLIAKPRPAGRPLTERLAALADFATDPPDANHNDRVVRASGVINTASLIASDVGLHSLAETMSWQHYQAFADASSLDASTAVMALQPLINITRLMTRRGEGRSAFEALRQLLHAGQQRGAADIGTGTADIGAIIHGDQQHHDVCQHLWATVLEDGLRSLLAAGEWQMAARQAAAHKGIGRRLWSGRQAVILELLQAGHAAGALDMVGTSETTNSDDQAVQALLHTFCALDGHLPSDKLHTATSHAHRLIAIDDPTTIHFRTQAALTAIALTDLAKQPNSELRQATITAAAIDAYAARAVIAALGEEAHRLHPVVAAGGLGNGAAQLPGVETELAGHTDRAIDRLHELLAA